MYLHSPRLHIYNEHWKPKHHSVLWKCNNTLYGFPTPSRYSYNFHQAPTSCNLYSIRQYHSSMCSDTEGYKMLRPRTTQEVTFKCTWRYSTKCNSICTASKSAKYSSLWFALYMWTQYFSYSRSALGLHISVSANLMLESWPSQYYVTRYEKRDLIIDLHYVS